MKNVLWKLFAWVVSRKPVADYLIDRAARTPYSDLPGYMERNWLFNPYGTDADGNVTDAKIKWLPSVRIHHILREDLADHPHDHPWDARTIILRGGYVEKRLSERDYEMLEAVGGWPPSYDTFGRKAGDTVPVLFGEYHHISYVTPGGAWTMFFTWGYKGTWGFLVGGRKVPWREYEERYQRKV